MFSLGQHLPILSQNHPPSLSDDLGNQDAMSRFPVQNRLPLFIDFVTKRILNLVQEKLRRIDRSTGRANEKFKLSGFYEIRPICFVKA